MVREALAALLGLEPDIEVVAQVARGDEVLAAARAARRGRGAPGHRDAGHDGHRGGGRAPPASCPGSSSSSSPPSAAPATCAARWSRAPTPSWSRTPRPPSSPTRYARSSPASASSTPTLAAAALAEGANPLTDREREVLRAAADGSTNAELATPCTSPRARSATTSPRPSRNWRPATAPRRSGSPVRRAGCCTRGRRRQLSLALAPRALPRHLASAVAAARSRPPASAYASSSAAPFRKSPRSTSSCARS